MPNEIVETRGTCWNFGTLAECRPERGWNKEHNRPDDCRIDCPMHEDFMKLREQQREERK